MSERSHSKSKLAHVAHLAGVSRSTASRALRDEGRVAPETVARIKKIAKAIGYQPDPLAKALRSGEGPKLVAIVVDSQTQFGHEGGEEVAHNFWFRFFYRLWHSLAEQDVAVVMTVNTNQDMLEELPLSAVLVPSTKWPRFEISSAIGDVPILVSGIPHPEDDPRIKGYMQYNDAQNARDALDHMWERGADRIALLIRGYHGQYAQETLTAYAKWCEERNLEQVVIDDDGTPDQLSEKIQREINNGADGVFCYLPNSRTTIEAIKETGKSFPEDILLVAYAEGVTEELEVPSVTTLEMQSFKVADTLVELVVDVIDSGLDGREEVFVDAVITPRDSTDRPVVREVPRRD